jgi:SAM-dependent methyltransferase
MKKWTAAQLLELGRSYQNAAIFLAAAELDLFAALAPKPLDASALAAKLHADPRALTILLDALTALELLRKQKNRYSLAPGAKDFLLHDTPASTLAMAQHQANCLRRWTELARTVQTGQPAERRPSVRGEEGDAASFIEAMDNVSKSVANEVIKAIKPLKFQHILDVGGGSGTWTIAFMRAWPKAKATLFDLPHVIPMAARRFAMAGLADRVNLIPGDYNNDPIPSGADLVWVSAIVHQNSREENRALFAKIAQSLAPGGHIAIRDIVMNAGHVAPISGALFAINMLVSTPGGGTFTLDELREDLESAGFSKIKLQRRDPGMNAVVIATRKSISLH